MGRARDGNGGSGNGTSMSNVGRLGKLGSDGKPGGTGIGNARLGNGGMTHLEAIRASPSHWLTTSLS